MRLLSRLFSMFMRSRRTAPGSRSMRGGSGGYGRSVGGRRGGYGRGGGGLMGMLRRATR